MTEEVTISPYTVPNDIRQECVRCHERFTPYRRRHHCRCCGEVVCSSCSPSKSHIPGIEHHKDRAIQDEHRVERCCKPCKAHLDRGVGFCLLRLSTIIASPGADTFHKHSAVHGLCRILEARAKGLGTGGGEVGTGVKVEPGAEVVVDAGTEAGMGAGLGIEWEKETKTGLGEMEQVTGGLSALFLALAPMLSNDVSWDGKVNGTKGNTSAGVEGESLNPHHVPH
ncbi:unnamed protein product [Choristocarpus tenellus]